MTDTEIAPPTQAERKSLREHYDYCLRSRGVASNKLHLPQEGTTPHCHRQYTEIEFDKREWNVYPIGFLEICKPCLDHYREYEQ